MPVRTRRLMGILALAGAAACATHAEHPRLLLTPEELPAIRARCGVRPAAGATYGFGTHATEYQTLRAWFAARPDGPPQPGELVAAAFLHLVAPGGDGDAARLRMIETALLEPPLLLDDDFELVVALDWCWDALAPTTRDEFLVRIRRETAALTPADSPLDHRTFRPKLAALAACVVAGTSDRVNAAWLTPREEFVQAANAYWRDTFPKFVRFRGGVPTTADAGADEESDAALLLDVLRAGGAARAWPSMRDEVGRWMEHHALGAAPGRPVVPFDRWDDMKPITAHLIAARTNDPAAAWVADEVVRRMKSRDADPAAILWQWAPIVFDLTGVPRYDPLQAPAFRNLGGEIVFSGETDGTPLRVTLAAGQPFLRRGQAFDAGSFTVAARHTLSGSAAQPIETEAVPSKGGTQRIGQAPGQFDFAQFNTATIAHNAMIFWDEVRLLRWYGALYAPVGGQVPREDTCREFQIPPADQQRSGGTLTACGADGELAYASLDLSATYDPRSVVSTTREILFLRDRFVVIDRARTTSPRVEPVFVMQLPMRPRVNDGELPDAARVDGRSDAGGVWRFDGAESVSWSRDRDALHVQPLWPRGAVTSLVGGPAQDLPIESDRWKGLRYVGGSADSFERRVQPAGRRDFENAWYRLGAPVLLDREALSEPVWGRIEIEPATRRGTYLGVVLVTFARAGAPPPRPPTASEADGWLTIEDLPVGGTVRIRLEQPGGVVRRPDGSEWSLPTTVMPDPPLPVGE